MKLYRILAIILIVIGAYLVATALRDAMIQPLRFPISCNNDDCRLILADGTLSSVTVARPAEVTR